jgi:DNA replication and repair protein RecF
VVAETGSPPVLLLDDVFSELDPARSRALVANLPPGQTVLTTAAGLPPDTRPDVVLRLHDGAITVAGNAGDVAPGVSPDG